MAGKSRLEGEIVKKSEREAKERLRNHEGLAGDNMVTRVTRKGASIEFNEGQSIKQGFGSGIKDILAARAAKKARGGK